MIKNDGVEEDLATFQKNTENAAKKVVHRTKEEREKEIMSTPENVRVREEAAARCTAKLKRRILWKQARKARAEHLVKCSLELGKKEAKRKPLTELYVKGHFTEDREEWQKELQRHCERCTPTCRKQKNLKKKELNTSRKKGIRQFTEEGRSAEITADLVLQARAKLSDNKRRRDRERDDQKVAHGEDLHYNQVFSGTLHETDGISKFVEDREISLLEETGRCQKKGIRSYRAIALT